MPAYYNENDPRAAAWLRELARAGHIAPGDVDERDIRDVRPDELARYTQCHFFAGIGVWSHSLRLADWPDDMPVWTGSCPCQPFSQAGKGKGFADERHLWPAWFHLISERRPVAVFGEQVASDDGLSWLDIVRSDLEGEAYTVGCADLCAAGVGAPHIRQRIFFVADTDGGNAGTERIQRGRQHRQLKEDCLVGKLADCGRRGRSELGAPRLHAHRPSGNNIAGCSTARNLADPSSGRRREFGHEAQSRSGGYADGGVIAGRLGDAHGGGAGQHARELPANEAEHAQRSTNSDHSSVAASPARDLGYTCGPRLSAREFAELLGAWRREEGRTTEQSSCAPGPVNGYWNDADWIWCRDEKWRPVEPGSSPLVTGAPERVGRLRGFGNAINAEVAAAFVRAYLTR